MRDVAVAVAIAITTKSNMAEYLEHRNSRTRRRTRQQTDQQNASVSCWHLQFWNI